MYGEDVKEVKQLPAQQDDGEDYHQHSQKLANVHSSFVRFELPGAKTDDIQGSEGKNHNPKNIIETRAGVGGLQEKCTQHGRTWAYRFAEQARELTEAFPGANHREREGRQHGEVRKA